MSAPNDPLEATRKRLMWRASRRGIKEMDIMVGGFATQALPLMSESELKTFETLLDIPDQLLLSYVTEQEPVPEHLDAPMLRALLAFRPELKT
jgi:antitoxin CptB